MFSFAMFFKIPFRGGVIIITIPLLNERVDKGSDFWSIRLKGGLKVFLSIIRR